MDSREEDEGVLRACDGASTCSDLALPSTTKAVNGNSFTEVEESVRWQILTKFSGRKRPTGKLKGWGGGR